MAQRGESKPCLMFTVKKKTKNYEDFDSTELYAFDELFVNLEDEGGNKKSADNTSGNEVALPVSRLVNYHTNARFATINSVIYRVGGFFYHDTLLKQIWIDYCKSVSCRNGLDDSFTAKADLCHEGRKNIDYCDIADEKCWKQGPQLNFPRINPHLLVLRGRLYVAGGFIQMPDDSAFMEILEEGAESWCVLPNHPVAVEKLDYFMSAAVDEMGFILIITGREFPRAFTYKPDERVWQPFDGIEIREETVCDYNCRPAVVVGKIALWVDDENGTYVAGVDLSSHKCVTFGFNMVTQVLFHTPRFHGDFLQLVSFSNGEFCLLWRGTEKYACKCADNGSGEIVGADYHCLTFRLSLDLSTRGQGGPCNLKVVSRKKCIGPAAPDKPDCAFVQYCNSGEQSKQSLQPIFYCMGPLGRRSCDYPDGISVHEELYRSL
ncbi:hypothetical protein OROGR_007373 [Orobanche gracilis]